MFMYVFYLSGDEGDNIRAIVFGSVGIVLFLLVLTAVVVATVVIAVFLRRKHSHGNQYSIVRKNSEDLSSVV